MASLCECFAASALPVATGFDLEYRAKEVYKAEFCVIQTPCNMKTPTVTSHRGISDGFLRKNSALSFDSLPLIVGKRQKHILVLRLKERVEGSND